MEEYAKKYSEGDLREVAGGYEMLNDQTGEWEMVSPKLNDIIAKQIAEIE